MNEDTTSGTARATARRRLLRGSFAVPTVMTLSSGSVLAASSSIRCFANMPNGTDIVTSPDNYFRVRRYTYFKGSVTNKLVKAADITALASLKGFDAATFVSGKGDWINVANGAAFAVGPGGQGPNLEDAYVALRFENYGTDELPNFRVTGLAPSSSGLSGTAKVMTSSCWTSVL